MKKINETNEILNFFKNNSAVPEIVNQYLIKIGSSPIEQKIRYEKIIPRPNVNISDIAEYDENLRNFLMTKDKESIFQAEILLKYDDYIQREQEQVEKLNKWKNLKLNTDFDYDRIPSLSSESRQKLKKFKPSSIEEASKISGISPADINILIMHVIK
jgi:tRNA uridine 5-carboxymethylaminomethyl modification enzyme